jgi:hypothetical protein
MRQDGGELFLTLEQLRFHEALLRGVRGLGDEILRGALGIANQAHPVLHVHDAPVLFHEPFVGGRGIAALPHEGAGFAGFFQVFGVGKLEKRHFQQLGP